VIAITGMDDHGWQKRGQEAGVNHVVRKPFDPMMFIDFIRRVIVSTVR
jgi:DNA-binding response OmpR family regulator